MKRTLFAAIALLLLSGTAHAFQEGFPNATSIISSYQLRQNLDEMYQFGKKQFTPGTISAKTLPYKGGKVCFGSTVYTMTDDTADFSAFSNGNVVYVSIIESGGNAVLSKDLTAYNGQGIPLWKVTMGPSAISSVSDERTWVSKGNNATVKQTQDYAFEGIWGTYGSNTDKFTVQRQGTAVSLVYNAYYSGGAWTVRDTGKPQSRIDYTATGYVEFYTSPAGGSCSWTKVACIQPTEVQIHKKTTVDAPVEVSGTTSYLKLPSLTTTQRDALTAANGMQIYNSTTAQTERYDNGAWTAGAAAGSITTAMLADGAVTNAKLGGGPVTFKVPEKSSSGAGFNKVFSTTVFIPSGCNYLYIRARMKNSGAGITGQARFGVGSTYSDTQTTTSASYSTKDFKLDVSALSGLQTLDVWLGVASGPGSTYILKDIDTSTTPDTDFAPAAYFDAI